MRAAIYARYPTENQREASTEDQVEVCRRVTERLFGTPIRPQHFRHCAATDLAIDSPRLARMTRAILGHTINRTGERYYNMVTALEACRRHAAAIDHLRNTLTAEYGGP